MQVPEFIETLVGAGIEITIGFSNDYGIYFDVNTDMKSHCHLAYNSDGRLIAHQRYGAEDEVEDFDDLCWVVKGCMCGRDYLSSAWAKILVEKGILEKKVETKVSYI